MGYNNKQEEYDIVIALFSLIILVVAIVFILLIFELK